MWNGRLVLAAWDAQKRQALQWRQGDAFAGAAAALRIFTNVAKNPTVKRHFWRHILYNLLMLLVLLLLAICLYAVMAILCGLIGMLGWEIPPPSPFDTVRWVVWIQVALWSALLRYFFHHATEDCFYSRLNEIEVNRGESRRLSKVQTWKGQSILDATWGSIKRTLRYYV